MLSITPKLYRKPHHSWSRPTKESDKFYRTPVEERLFQEASPEEMAWSSINKRQIDRHQYAKAVAKIVLEKLQLKLMKATLKDVLDLSQDRKWMESVMLA